MSDIHYRQVLADLDAQGGMSEQTLDELTKRLDREREKFLSADECQKLMAHVGSEAFKNQAKAGRKKKSDWARAVVFFETVNNWYANQMRSISSLEAERSVPPPPKRQGPPPLPSQLPPRRNGPPPLPVSQLPPKKKGPPPLPPRIERSELPAAAPTSLDTSRSSEPNRVGFLKRHPKKIKAEDLHDGGFLLSKKLRSEIEERIKLGIRDTFLVKDHTPAGAMTEFKVYINQDNEAFVLGPKLGQGAFGEVFIAQNALTGKWHCMKRLETGKLEDAELDVLAQEGMYRSSERTSDADLFIGELIQGRGLDDIIEENKKNKTLSFEQVLALNISLVEAYESLQGKGYIHRDIKPANVMVDVDQQKCIAIDFGLVKRVGDPGGELSGSPVYMTLDMVRGKPPSFKDDIYAIGLTGGQILSSMYDTEDYSQLSPDTLSERILKRKQYAQAIDERWKKFDEGVQEDQRIGEAGSIAHSEISHVILGAEHEPYQNNLSKEEIELCKLIFKMTAGKADNRPELSEARSSMIKIRLDHIQKRIESFSDSPYREVLKSLFQKRGSLRKTPHLLDNLDVFLLRMVDQYEKNRPSLTEAKRYQAKLDAVLQQKQKVGESIQNLSIEANAKLTAAEQELIALNKKLDQMKRYSSDPVAQHTIKSLQNKIHLLQQDIAKRMGNSVKNEVVFKQIMQLSKACDNFDKIVNLKKIINQLKDENKNYLDQYEKKEKKRVGRTGVLLLADTEKKYQNAVQLNAQLEKLFNADIFEPNEFVKLVKKHRDLDKKSMGLLSSTKSSQVESMLKKAESSLNQLSGQNKQSQVKSDDHESDKRRI